MKNKLLSLILFFTAFHIDLPAQILLEKHGCNSLIASCETTEIALYDNHDLVLERKITNEVWASTIKSYKVPKAIFLNLQPGIYRVQYTNPNFSQSNEKGNIRVSNEIIIDDCSTHKVINQYDTQVLITPNPASQNIQIIIPLEKIGCTVTLCDVTGRAVFSVEITEESTFLPLNNFTTGLYFLFFKKDEMPFSYKKLLIK